METKSRIPLSVLIATRNEEDNISKCLVPLYDWADEILIVDSQSQDKTVEIAESFGATVLQFHYKGGWPKKRQWALDTYAFRNDWILLLDADEVLLDGIKEEIEGAIKSDEYDGYWLKFQLFFLGRQLKHGGFDLWKLFLFRKGKGAYEKRLEDQDAQMSDIEIHEHVVVKGKVGRLHSPIRHENFNSLFRYIAKHNEYSEWEAGVYFSGHQGELPPSLWGTQAQRRRWLKTKLFRVPGFSLMTFIYHYILLFGFLDGKAGFIYCCLKGVQRFHAKSKLYELEMEAEAQKSKESSLTTIEENYATDRAEYKERATHS